MSFPTRRLRRLRTSDKMRELVQQTTLSPKDFICPVFVQEDLKTRTGRLGLYFTKREFLSCHFQPDVFVD